MSATMREAFLGKSHDLTTFQSPFSTLLASNSSNGLDELSPNIPWWCHIYLAAGNTQSYGALHWRCADPRLRRAIHSGWWTIWVYRWEPKNLPICLGALSRHELSGTMGQLLQWNFQWLQVFPLCRRNRCSWTSLHTAGLTPGSNPCWQDSQLGVLKRSLRSLHVPQNCRGLLHIHIELCEVCKHTSQPHLERHTLWIQPCTDRSASGPKASLVEFTSAPAYKLPVGVTGNLSGGHFTDCSQVLLVPGRPDYAK